MLRVDGAAQRMLERRARGGAPGVFTGILIAAAVSLLPMCDACDEAAAMNALSGAGLSSGGTTSALLPTLFWLAIAVAIVVVVVKASRVPARALPVVILGVAIAAWMVCSSSAGIARTRSNAIDTWPVCYDADRACYTFGPPLFDGPHECDGSPCVMESENRRSHWHEHPSGDVADGIHQIFYRFRGDRARVIYIPFALLLGLVVALALAVVAAVRGRGRAVDSSSA
jgi:hypothetical protein